MTARKLVLLAASLLCSCSSAPRTGEPFLLRGTVQAWEYWRQTQEAANVQAALEKYGDQPYWNSFAGTLPATEHTLGGNEMATKTETKQQKVTRMVVVKGKLDPEQLAGYQAAIAKVLNEYVGKTLAWDEVQKAVLPKLTFDKKRDADAKRYHISHHLNAMAKAGLIAVKKAA